MYTYYAPDFDVKISGLSLTADIRNAVMSLTYDNNLETADMFRLQINNADLRFIDSPLFDVGQRVEIYLGYAGALEPMMLGEITALSPTFPQGGAPTLSVTGYDLSHRMRHNQPDRERFQSMSDSAIAKFLAEENQLIPLVDPCPTESRKSVQQTGSDWALLQEMADRNHFQVYVYWDKLYFRPCRTQMELVTLEWGKNLSSFTPRLSTSGQGGRQTVRSYDYSQAQPNGVSLSAMELGSDTELDAIGERLGPEEMERLLSQGGHVERDRTVENQADADAVAKSLLLKQLSGLYEGSGNCIGMPQLRAGNRIKILGLGKKFSGEYTLSKVTHTLNDSGYQTSFEVTQSAAATLLQSLRQKVVESPSPNRQARQNHPVVGIVENNQDPEELGRVQVRFPHLSDNNRSNWARVASPMVGSEGRGAWFLPEEGDEVTVQFEQGDIDRPIVIGSVPNGDNRPPEEERNVRSIRSRAGHEISLNDTEGSEGITILNKRGGSSIQLREDGTIELRAGEGKDIKLFAQNVKVHVAGEMNVSE